MGMIWNITVPKDGVSEYSLKALCRGIHSQACADLGAKTSSFQRQQQGIIYKTVINI